MTTTDQRASFRQSVSVAPTLRAATPRSATTGSELPVFGSFG
jgi:hypothetical protein